MDEKAPRMFRVYEDGAVNDACKSCGAELTKYETLSGKRMPVRRGAVPLKSEFDRAMHRTVVFFDAADSHFADCPDAASYSGKAKRAEASR